MQLDPSLCADLERAARMFRLGMDADGNECLVRIVDGLVKYLEGAPSETQERVLGSVNELVAAQERGDTLRIADLAEYGILPAMQG